MIKTTEKKLSTRSPTEVFVTFLKLGLTSFGGPIAHLGYFRMEFVERRGWLSDNQFGQLLAICQFLPGPASSQLGFCIGLQRAGWLGALSAFLGFTLPSALLLIAFATTLPMLSDPIVDTVIHGLKLVACAVVADAVLGMSKTLCPDVTRRTIALLTLATLLVVSSAIVQLLLVVLAAIGGALLLRNISVPENTHKIQISYGSNVGVFLILLFTALLVGLPIFATSSPTFASVAAAFYRAGALVFGGGACCSAVAAGFCRGDRLGDTGSVFGWLWRISSYSRTDVCVFGLFRFDILSGRKRLGYGCAGIEFYVPSWFFIGHWGSTILASYFT